MENHNLKIENNETVIHYSLCYFGPVYHRLHRAQYFQRG
jgi:hypothetical protein